MKGASTKLVQSMFRIGRKVTELERQKLQTEIRKEESEIRRQKLEKCVQMASNRGRKGGAMKSPKVEIQEDDDDFLEDLVVDTKPTTYSNLKPGGFIMKAEDCKGRLEKRQARIATAREQDNDDDDDDDDDDEDDDKKESRQLQSELRKTKRVAEKARDQEEKEKAR